MIVELIIVGLVVLAVAVIVYDRFIKKESCCGCSCGNEGGCACHTLREEKCDCGCSDEEPAACDCGCSDEPAECDCGCADAEPCDCETSDDEE